MEFCLREQGIWDKRGKVTETFQGGEEFLDGKVWWIVGGQENIGDILCSNKFHNRNHVQLCKLCIVLWFQSGSILCEILVWK